MPLKLTRRGRDGGINAHVHPGDGGIKLNDEGWFGDDDFLAWFRPATLPGEHSVVWVEFGDLYIHGTRAYLIRVNEHVQGAPTSHYGVLPRGTTDADIPLVSRVVTNRFRRHLRYNLRPGDVWTVDTRIGGGVGSYDASDAETVDNSPMPVDDLWVHAWTNGSSLSMGTCICVYETTGQDDTIKVHYGESSIGPEIYDMVPRTIDTFELKTVDVPILRF